MWKLFKEYYLNDNTNKGEVMKTYTNKLDQSVKVKIVGRIKINCREQRKCVDVEFPSGEVCTVWCDQLT